MRRIQVLEMIQLEVKLFEPIVLVFCEKEENGFGQCARRVAYLDVENGERRAGIETDELDEFALTKCQMS